MNIRPIHTEADHRAALRTLSAYFDNEPEPDTPEGDHFEVLLTLVEAYEAEAVPVDAPSPVEAIKFRMDQAGLTPKDLEPAIGRRNRVYEVLNGTRALSLPMIRRLHAMFEIPLACLVEPPIKELA